MAAPPKGGPATATPPRPARARLAEVRAIVGPLLDAREIWETLATRGVIPSAWLSDENRAFTCVAADGSRRAPFPPTPAACLAIASDIENVITAEAIARELARAAEEPIERILWRIGQSATISRGSSGQVPPRAPDGWIDRVDAITQLGYGLAAVGPQEIILVSPEVIEG